MTRHPAVCQVWEEYERGWGSRPDGYSLHLTMANVARFVSTHWDSLPDIQPAQYDCPVGLPYLVDVDETIYTRLTTSNLGLRFYTGPRPRPA